jgi:hypothetical protein
MIRRRIARIEAMLSRGELHARMQQPARPLQTVQDVIDLLQEQVESIRAEPWADAITKARALGYLAGVARKTIELGTLAERLEVLEAVLKQRKADLSGRA